MSMYVDDIIKKTSDTISDVSPSLVTVSARNAESPPIVLEETRLRPPIFFFNVQSIGAFTSDVILSMKKLNYILINCICIYQHHPTHIISLIQIWYKTTSRLKPNPWRLVIQGHEYAIFSYMYLIF